MNNKDESEVVFYNLVARLLATNISLLHNQSKQSGSQELTDMNDILLTSLRKWLISIKGNENLPLNIRNIVSMVDNIIQQNVRELLPEESNFNDNQAQIIQKLDSNLSLKREMEETKALGSNKEPDPPLARTSRTLELLDRITEIGKDEEKIKVTQLFQRMLTPNDQWSYLETTETILRNYSHIMHLALPNYCFAILEDLHRYTSEDFEILNTIISVPYYALLELIQKFLREAPSATILRRFRSTRRMAQIDIDEDTSVDITQKNEVKLIVDEYFKTLRAFFDSEKSPTFQSYYTKVKEQYNKFSLGPSQVESRIIIVVKNVMENLIKKLDQEKIDLTLYEKVATLGTVDIFMNLTDYWLGKGKIRSLLEAMKD